MEYSDLYQVLCLTISGRAGQVDWSGWSVDAWSDFYDLAKAQGVAPLVYWTFKGDDWPDGSPREVHTRFTKAYYETSAYNQLLYRELERILVLLNEADVPVVVLKGAALAESLYPDIGLRPMNDLDLLIHRNDLIKASDSIKSLGYLVESTERFPGVGLFYDHEKSFRNLSNDNLVIELHWGLIAGDADWRSPAVDWFFGQTEKVNAKNIPLSFAILNTPTHLIYLSAHQMLQHGEEQARLCWLYDLHLLICQDGNEIDWRKLFTDANQFHWGPVIGSALREVHMLFGTPLPDNFDILVNEYQDQRTLVLLERRSHPPESRLMREFRRIQTLNWRARILFVLAIICPSPSHIKRHYHPKPSWLWPLYYFYRWLDMLIDGLYNFPKIILERFRKRGI